MLSPSNVTYTSRSARIWATRFSARNPAPPHASRASCRVSRACHVVSGFTAAASVSSSCRSTSVSERPEKTSSNFSTSSLEAKASA